MTIDDFREEEIQAIIVLAELTYPFENPNNNSYKPFPKNIVEAQTYFRRFSLVLSEAFISLKSKGLVWKKNEEWFLTDLGKDISYTVRQLRPPIYYWYKDFYSAIEHSKTFSVFSIRAFGKNLDQHGFSDLNQIHKVLELVKLDKSSQVLDIGCGSGKIAEYITDVTQASVTGVDYVPEAIKQAITRTRDKSDRLYFKLENLEDMDFQKDSFDLILSIDSIYFIDTKDALSKWNKLLKPAGKMAIFYLDMNGGDLTVLLKDGNFSFVTHDISRKNYEHLQMKHRIARDLKEAFEEEGNAFIWKNLMAESVASTDPYDPTRTSIRRYLYIVSKNSQQ